MLGNYCMGWAWSAFTLRKHYVYKINKMRIANSCIVFQTQQTSSKLLRCIFHYKVAARIYSALRATDLSHNERLCWEKKEEEYKAGDEVIQRCQLVAACYLPSICSHSSSVFNRLLTIVWGWREEKKRWKRRVWMQIRGFSFPRDRITRKLQLQLREWVIPALGVPGV